MSDQDKPKADETNLLRPQQFVRYALAHIAEDFTTRLGVVISNAQVSVFGTLLIIPRVRAQQEAGYSSLEGDEPTYNTFVPGESNSTIVQADINNFLATSLQFESWKARASAIRSSHNSRFCVGNLSVALQSAGAAYTASSQGATTLLSLLPTAGALIGAPAKELWVLFKLMPIAGVLSMLISLGGNIVPMEVNQYERVDAFEYQGFIATTRRSDTMDAETDFSRVHPDHRKAAEPKRAIHPARTASGAQEFSEVVYQRAMHPLGYRPTTEITIGILIQLFLISVLLFTCWFVGIGSVVVWACRVWGWMYLWYLAVAGASLFENIAGVPFSRQWSIRVSRAPSVRISEDAPWVIPEPEMITSKRTSSPEPIVVPEKTKTPDVLAQPTDTVVPIKSQNSTSDLKSDAGSNNKVTTIGRSHTAGFPMEARQVEILNRLEKGYNTTGKIYIDKSKPWSAASDVFYVLISIKGVSSWHAFARVLSKMASIAVFAFGTAMFASSTLVTILIAMTVACLVLCSGIFGRVTAMWMASVMMRNKPVIHKVVKDKEEAAEFIEAILRQPNMVCEILGHVIVEGRCVKRFRKGFRWSHLLGVLASPYDLSRLATDYRS